MTSAVDVKSSAAEGSRLIYLAKTPLESERFGALAPCDLLPFYLSLILSLDLASIMCVYVRYSGTWPNSQKAPG